jgi:hypothetical protein
MTIIRDLEMLVDLSAERAVKADRDLGPGSIAALLAHARLESYCHALLILRGVTPTDTRIADLAIAAVEKAMVTEAVS